ncbi:hypothetical protein NBRC116594_09450 [Shimia sp. NS0008-38b]
MLFRTPGAWQKANIKDLPPQPTGNFFSCWVTIEATLGLKTVFKRTRNDAQMARKSGHRLLI